MAFPQSKLVEKESLTFQNKDSGGLPNYFGEGPAPIEINCTTGVNKLQLLYNCHDPLLQGKQ